MAVATTPGGWPLLPVPDEGGALRYPVPEASVRQAIEVLLRTRPGEQLMRPEFGGGLDALLHEPNTLATRARIRERIADALARWEPRIAVERIDVDPASDDPAQVRVVIAYRMRQGGEAARVGLRLVLGGP